MIPKDAFQDHSFISAFRSKTRRRMILDYMGTSNPHTMMRLNELILWESKLVLKKRGQKYNVVSGKGDKRTLKIGHCFANSVQKMRGGFGYVEGFVRNKQTGQYIGHAWNIDKSGNHMDFTFKNTDEFEYFSVIVPEEVVWSVGERNGHIWYCVLPFIDSEFNYRE